MTVLTIPTLTHAELYRRAVEDWGAVTNMAYTDLTPEKAQDIAGRAVQNAIDDWCFESGELDVPLDMRALVLAHVIAAGWDEWERMQQLDLFLDEDIWRGAAIHEARRELE